MWRVKEKGVIHISEMGAIILACSQGIVKDYVRYELDENTIREGKLAVDTSGLPVVLRADTEHQESGENAISE